MKVILTETQINRLLEQNTDLITTIKQMGFVPSGNAIFKHSQKPELTLTLVGDYIIVKDNGKEISKIKTSEIEDLEGTIKSTSLKIKSTSLKEQVSPDVKEKVIKIQTKLKGKGYNLGTSGPNKDGVDGKWGPKTALAVVNALKTTTPQQPAQTQQSIPQQPAQTQQTLPTLPAGTVQRTNTNTQLAPGTPQVTQQPQRVRDEEGAVTPIQGLRRRLQRQ